MTHTYWLSYMHVYLLSQFPSSSSLSWWLWGEEEEAEEETVLGVIVPEGELTKVGHSYSPAPLFPLETSWFFTLSGNPAGLSFSISAIYSFCISAHFSFCLSQCRAFIVASRSCYVSCFLLWFGLWGWFKPLSLSGSYHRDFAYSAGSLSCVFIKSTNSSSDLFSLSLSLNFP